MLPYINEISKTRSFLDEFRGYNARERIAENEFSDCLNISNDKYPVLSTRAPRGKLELKSFSVTKILGILGGEELAVLARVNKEDGECVRLIYGDEEYDLRLPKDYQEKSSLIQMGAYIIIFPARIAFNTVDKTVKSWGNGRYFSKMPKNSEGTLYEKSEFTVKHILKGYNVADGTFYYEEIKLGETFVWCDEDGKEPEAGVYFEEPLELYRITKDGNVPVNMANVYLCVSGVAEIKAYRYVPVKDANLTLRCYAKYEDAADGYLEWIKILVREGSEDREVKSISKFVFEQIGGEDCLLARGYMPGLERVRVRTDAAGLTTMVLKWKYGWFEAVPFDDLTGDYKEWYRGSISLCWDNPELDYIVEAQNRLWGCRYGTAANGEIVNEIYCTALGKFDDWYSSDGLSAAEGWAAGVGVPGEFTGAVAFGQTPIFFKEDVAYKVYPSSSGAHQIYKLDIRGVERGSDASIALINGYAFYKSREGVMLFDGSTATKISERLGNKRYVNAVAGAEVDKYVTYCEAPGGNERLILTYDTALGLWQKESTTGEIKYMAQHDGALVMASESTLQLYDAARHNNAQAEKDVSYYFESGDIGYSSPDKKYICRLDFKVALELGASFNVFVRYDGEKKYRSVASVRGRNEIPKTETVFVMPRRCEHFRIKVSGTGNFKLYSISRIYEISEN